MSYDARAQTKISVTQVTTSIQEVTLENLGRAILRYVWQELGCPDDAGCDWYTAGDAIVISGNPHLNDGVDFRLARLVDAANLLIYRHTLEVDPDAIPTETRDPAWGQYRDVEVPIYLRASRRIDQHSALTLYRDVLLKTHPVDHDSFWSWVVNAPLDEILSWAEKTAEELKANT